MKIAFYIHHTTISAGGIYTYTIGILKLLINSPKIEKIVIITSKEIANTLYAYNASNKIEIRKVDRKKTAIKLRLIFWYGLYISVQIAKEILGSLHLFDKIKSLLCRINPYDKILKESNVEVFLVPVQYSPIYKTDVPVIITMHDLQEYHFPEYFSFREKLHRKINNNIAINDSSQIVCSFEHVKNDIVKYFGIDSNKVSVCPPPFADDWFLSKKESDWNHIQKKYRLRKNYILYPAATWKHKNHKTLIKAVKEIITSNINIELVCTGNKTNYYSSIAKLISEQNLSGAVHFLGIVSEEDLIALYKNSSLVVVPTLYEAGSGPLYEAMRYQVPVICSNVTSLPDTVGNSEFLFDPSDVNALADKIKIGLTDSEFRQRNFENSINRMDYFSKIDYSKNFTGLFQKLIKN